MENKTEVKLQGYCVKCKKKVDIIDGQQQKIKRGYMLLGKCPLCSCKCSKLLKKEEVKENGQ